MLKKKFQFNEYNTLFLHDQVYIYTLLWVEHNTLTLFNLCMLVIENENKKGDNLAKTIFIHKKKNNFVLIFNKRLEFFKINLKCI